MPLSDEDVADLIAEWKRVQRERETALRAALEKEYQQKAKWEKKIQKRELERLQYEAELECLQPDGDSDVPPVGGTAAVSADECGTCCRSTCG